MPRPVVVHVPVHRAEARAVNLHAVHADVARAVDGITRVDAAERDVAAGAGLPIDRLLRGLRIEDLSAPQIPVERPAVLTEK